MTLERAIEILEEYQEWRIGTRDEYPRFLPHELTEAIEKAIDKLSTLNKNKMSEWIPVTERLPEKDGDGSIMCLVYTIHRDIVCRPYNEYHKCWDDEDYDDHFTEPVGGEITHWMPLPEPPAK